MIMFQAHDGGYGILDITVHIEWILGYWEYCRRTRPSRECPKSQEVALDSSADADLRDWGLNLKSKIRM